MPDRRPRPAEALGLFLVLLAAGPAAAREVPIAGFPDPDWIDNAFLSRWAAVADVDGDGDLDVLATVTSDASVRWYENVGGDPWAWTARTIPTAGDDPMQVVGGDVDGDGDLDALVSFQLDDAVSWYQNTAGDGSTWTVHAVASPTGPPLGVGLGDLDGDGDLDVLTAASSAGLLWHENTAGDGTAWTQRTVSSTIVDPVSSAAADVDGDGDLDVLAAAQGGKVLWFENTAGNASAWTERAVDASAGGPTSALAGDLDGDGDLDVVAHVAHGSEIAWYENTAGDASAWSKAAIDDAVSVPTSSALADFDGDGDLDVLATLYLDEELVWYENAAGDASAWTRRGVDDDLVRAQSVAVGDVDRDGDVDAVAAVSDVFAWYRNDTIHRSALLQEAVVVEPDPTTPGLAPVSAAGDLDGDGDLDAFAGPQWYESTAGATAWTRHDLGAGWPGHPDGAALADLDGDGDLDGVGVDASGDIVTWSENTAGDASAWTGHQISAAADHPLAVAAADLDGDGDLDVLVASRDDDTVRWFENGAGDASTWTARTVTAAADLVRQVSAADFDGDGDLDVLANRDDLHLSWYENAGPAGPWTRHDVSGAADFPDAARAEDLDGDGDEDVVFVAGAELAWYENTAGDGSSWPATPAVIATGGSSAFALADLDLDGDLDVATFRQADHALTWWENTAGDASAWAPRESLPSLGDPGSVVLADFDGDGDPDALASSDEIVLRANRGGQVVLATTDVAQKVVGDGEVHELLTIEATHLGRSGDGDQELTEVRVRLTDGSGSPVPGVEANLLLENLWVYSDDDGDGTWQPGPDFMLSWIANVQPDADGELTFLLPPGPEANNRVVHGTPKSYFVIGEIDSLATSNAPASFELRHLVADSVAEDRDHGIPLLQEPAEEVSTGLLHLALDSTSCSAPFDLRLAHRTIAETVVCQAGTEIATGADLEVAAGGALVLRAGEAVALGDGFRVVSGGSLEVEIDPTLAP